MIRAVELFRKKADECERRAKGTADKSEQAELMDMCAEFHWLSGEVARLQGRMTQLDGPEPFPEASLLDGARSIIPALETSAPGRMQADV